jgi:nucleoside-diphosphate-sugar epimerase
MKIIDFFITGGTGFLGSAVTNFLLSKNYKILILDNNSRGKITRISKSNNLFFVKGDIRNIKDLNKCSKFKIKNIIHLAFINGTKNFYNRPLEVLEIGYLGMINIINFAIKNKIKNFFLSSSSEVYGNPSRIPTDENEEIKIENILNPRFTYSGGKIFSELLAVNYGRKYFERMIIFRPHNVYGPDMGNDHVIPEIINKIRVSKRKIIKYLGTGNETRAFMYIDDFCLALYKIIKKGKNLNIYNIGVQKETTMKNLFSIIKKNIFFNKKINFIPSRQRLKGSPLRRCPNIKKIRNLGFKPNYSLEEGIKATIMNTKF